MIPSWISISIYIFCSNTDRLGARLGCLGSYITSLGFYIPGEPILDGHL